jgi:RNA polymerase sigma-70 factor (ECF subfamily)
VHVHPDPVDAAVLARARRGDHEAFAQLVRPFEPELRRHCYRLLGSPADADDALQETLLAAWKGLPRFEARSSVRTWLYRIATHRCLNAARSSARRARHGPQPPFPVPAPTRLDAVGWLRPCPDAWLDDPACPSGDAPPDVTLEARESVEVAFVAALQELAPRQAAVLVLCDVLDFDLRETARLLGTTPTAVKGALQRARARVRARVPRGEPPAPGSLAERRLAARFAAAFVADDVDALLALLTDDVWLAMPPAALVYEGKAAARRFLEALAAGRDRVRVAALVPTRANGQPAFGWYVVRAGDSRPTGAGVVVLTLRGEQIAGVTRFVDDGLVAAFGLPADPASRVP